MGYCYQKEREEIIKVGRELLNLDILTGFEGNISIKLNNNKMVITPSGRKIRELTPDNLVVSDFKGNLLEGEEKPSSGVPMHTMIYNLRPEVSAVIHTHSPFATSFAIAEKEIPNSLEVLKDIVGGTVPVASPYSPVGTHELANNVKNHINNSFAILLKNHGVLAFGKDINHAAQTSWAVEMAAKMVVNAKILGNVTTISD